MGPIGVLLAVLYVVLTIVWPVAKSMKFLWKQRWDVYKRLGYMGIAGAAGLAALVLVAMMPVRNSIREPLVVLSTSDEPVYVRMPGYVDGVEHDAGEQVKAGDVILRLKDPTLEGELTLRESQYKEQELNANKASADNKPDKLKAAQDAMAQLKTVIDRTHQQMDDLTLRAPVDGIRCAGLSEIMCRWD
jgi:putative peptide zinc metalloprotease protein